MADRYTPDACVSALCVQLSRAYRTFRFYPAEHPMATTALDRLTVAFREQLDRSGTIDLEVRESELTYHDAVVYHEESLRENLAFVLFRDGIRRLVFLPGLDEREVTALVRVLARAFEIDKAEHDLATLLWEEDFSHIDYEVVDPLLEREGDAGVALDRLKRRIRGRLEHAGSEDLAVVAEHPGADGPDPVTRAGTLLHKGDLERLEASIAGEGDVLEEFGIVLGEVLIAADSPLERAAAARALDGVLLSFLEWGELGALSREVRRLLQLGAMSQAHRAMFDGVLRDLSTSETLAKATAPLETQGPGRRREVEELLMLLRPWAYPALVDLLTGAENPVTRKALLNVLSADDGVPIDLLLARLEDPRWYVVRNMVYLLGTLRQPAVLDPLERALWHEDERVRREVIRALGAIPDPRSEELLLRALDDPEPSVRVLALRGLAQSQTETVRARLFTLSQDRERLAAKTEAEQNALLRAVATVGGDGAVPLLEGLWSTRSFFRSARQQRLRVAAVRALGFASGPRAEASLRRATRAGDEAVRREARRSLSETLEREVRVG